MGGKTRPERNPKLRSAPSPQSTFDKEVMVFFSSAVEAGRSALKKGVEDRKKREAMEHKNWASFRF